MRQRGKERKSIYNRLMNKLPVYLTGIVCEDYDVPQNCYTLFLSSQGARNLGCVSTILACHWLMTASNNINCLALLTCLMMLLENIFMVRGGPQIRYCCKYLQNKVSYRHIWIPWIPRGCGVPTISAKLNHICISV